MNRDKFSNIRDIFPEPDKKKILQKSYPREFQTNRHCSNETCPLASERAITFCIFVFSLIKVFCQFLSYSFLISSVNYVKHMLSFFNFCTEIIFSGLSRKPQSIEVQIFICNNRRPSSSREECSEEKVTYLHRCAQQNFILFLFYINMLSIEIFVFLREYKDMYEMEINDVLVK